MKTVTSISGGRTSAYLAANYPTDYNVFALVRIEDERCRFPDEKLRKRVEDRLQAPFIGTAEDDTIIHTIFDLEQYMGREITWVTGITFDEVIRTKGGWLPNKLHRYCTTNLKLQPIFDWWRKEIGEPIEMSIGYRANEGERAKKMLNKCNADGLNEMKAIVGRRRTQNKWGMVPWRKPRFPLLEDGIFKDFVDCLWKDKPVRFARYNNCVGCFHRNPIFLRKMAEEHENKMQWFADQEGGKNGYWRSDVPYSEILTYNLQTEIGWDEFSSCDSGLCSI